MDSIINARMLLHPVNWAIVWVVLALGALAFSQIKHAGGCACGNSDNA